MASALSVLCFVTRLRPLTQKGPGIAPRPFWLLTLRQELRFVFVRFGFDGLVVVVIGAFFGLAGGDQ